MPFARGMARRAPSTDERFQSADAEIKVEHGVRRRIVLKQLALCEGATMVSNATGYRTNPQQYREIRWPTSIDLFCREALRGTRRIWP
jgi:hypothetical protein